LYFGLLDSSLGGGRTVGKRVRDIRVTDRDGKTLSPGRSILRFLVIAVPFFLNGVWFDIDPVSVGWPDYLLGPLLIFVVFGGFGAIVYLYVFNRRTRQSLHDLAVGSFVVRDPPTGVPARLFTPRLHLIVVGCWLALALVAPLIGGFVAQQSGLMETLRPLHDLQNAIKSKLGMREVKVTVGTTTFAATRSATSTTSFLQIVAEPIATQDDLEALTLEIAGDVLNLHSDLLGIRILNIEVRHRFNFGIASWSQRHQEALDAAGWQERLWQVRHRPAGT